MLNVITVTAQNYHLELQMSESDDSSGMAQCALCQEVFQSRLQLVEHFSAAHSIARQRSRRTKVVEAVRKVALEAHDPEIVTLDEQGEVGLTVAPRQPLQCSKCEALFATPASLREHQCDAAEESHLKKQPVACQYCGQRCKDRRGAAIHQAFCEKRLQNQSDPSLSHLENKGTDGEQGTVLPECYAEDCGAIFKTEDQLARHVERHHGKEGHGVTPSQPRPSLHSPAFKAPTEAKRRPAQPPLVTVTMKPHVGKTEGLQDLSLLITPTKATEESPEYPPYDEGDYSSPKENIVKETPASITVEECRGLDPTLGIKCESILYVTEDGTVMEASDVDDSNSLEVAGEEETYIIIAGDEEKEDKGWKCPQCQQSYVTEDALEAHVACEHSLPESDAMQVKQEPMDADEDYLSNEYGDEMQDDDDDDDDDWELVTLGGKRRTRVTVDIRKGKVEYRCHMCKRHFLSELSYHTHVKNRECKNKKFKLPRMFSCHFKQCDSTFFKLTELQRHWQLAHKYSMVSRNLEFEDEKSFTDWLIKEEEKHKVRFTCDVRRRKPHRSERLLVCHRFHHLRTAAARKNANREYSDRHNWVHKIQPCLCFARLKVYQQFNTETCGYTGKISVVYYPEHSHPKTTVGEQGEVLDHVLQRNKRNRNKQFQDLKGTEKLLHRQKLEKLARLARKDCPLTPSLRAADSSRKLKIEAEDVTTTGRPDDPMVQVDHNLLGTDELFSSQVEMVLDGQFDMGPEELAGSVVTPLDSLQMFHNSRGGHSALKVEENLVLDRNDAQALEEETRLQKVEDGEDEEEEDAEDTVQAVLPATTEDWGKVFEMVRARVAKEEDAAVKAAASVLLPYERVIELVTPAEQVPIFRQLWDLACPSRQAQEGLAFEIMVMR